MPAIHILLRENAPYLPLPVYKERELLFYKGCLMNTANRSLGRINSEVCAAQQSVERYHSPSVLENQSSYVSIFAIVHRIIFPFEWTTSCVL